MIQQIGETVTFLVAVFVVRIERPIYLNKLIEFKDKDIVKIVTGIRRCGKSTLLDLYEDYLLNSGVKSANILHMNMESLQHRDLLGYLAFNDHVSNHIVKGEKTYLIFDWILMWIFTLQVQMPICFLRSSLPCSPADM